MPSHYVVSGGRKPARHFQDRNAADQAVNELVGEHQDAELSIFQYTSDGLDIYTCNKNSLGLQWETHIRLEREKAKGLAEFLGRLNLE